MMSESTNRIAGRNAEAFHRCGVPTRSEYARLSAEAQHGLRIRMACSGANADRDDLTLLQFKGFAGGVPQNTERTTVKPWVGIAR